MSLIAVLRLALWYRSSHGVSRNKAELSQTTTIQLELALSFSNMDAKTDSNIYGRSARPASYYRYRRFVCGGRQDSSAAPPLVINLPSRRAASRREDRPGHQEELHGVGRRDGGGRCARILGRKEFEAGAAGRSALSARLTTEHAGDYRGALVSTSDPYLGLYASFT